MRTQLTAVGGAALAVALAALHASTACAQYQPYPNYGVDRYQTAQPTSRYGASPASPYTAAAPGGVAQNPYPAPRVAAQPAGRYAAPTASVPPVYGYSSANQPPSSPIPGMSQALPRVATSASRRLAYQTPATEDVKELPGPGEDVVPQAVEEAAMEAGPTAGQVTTDVVYGGAPVHGVMGGPVGHAAHPCATHDYNGYFNVSSYDECSCSLNSLGHCDRPKRQWFGGVYGIVMKRDNPGTANVAVLVDGAPTGSYLPQPTDTWLRSSDALRDYAGGVEIRFGSTFGSAVAPYGCEAYQPCAWEMAYWELDEDTSSATLFDVFGGTTRIYGMINYTGLEYDRDGAGAGFGSQALNDFFDYQAPIDSMSTNTYRVLANRVRQTYRARNLELNFWRFNAAALGLVQSGPTAEKRFFLNGLMGVRFFEMDELFQNAVFFTEDDGAGGVSAGEPPGYPGGMPLNDDNAIFHDIDVDNELAGFQVGASANYLVGHRLTLFCDGAFGIYGNDIDVHQNFYSGGGGVVRVTADGAVASIRSSKQDVAFLGECRCGVGYQLSERWRATAAWRVIAASGVAVAIEQLPQNGYLSRAEAAYIDSNDSLILQGLQAGVECKY